MHADLVVETTSGPVRGPEVVSRVRRWLGIPYALPPIGPLRFRPPRPAERSAVVLDASAWGPRCPQPASALAPRRRGEVDSEDCLRLNVWAPSSSGPHPVMVWVHGGSFTTGSGALSWYDGARLARAGVVVVTVNYRLGLLGWFHLEPFGGDEWAGAANLGLADQKLALDWVRHNIEAFGGDAGRVTLFGESAGAMSVAAHLADRRIGRSIRAAIAQSGAATHVRSADEAAAGAERALAALGMHPADLTPGGIERLRSLPVAELVAPMATPDAAVGRPLGILPTVDGTWVPEPPLDALRRGSCADVNLVVGSNADEMRLFMAGVLGSIDDDRLHRRIDRALLADGIDGDAATVASDYRSRHVGASAGELAAAIETDRFFRRGVIATADAQLSGGGRASTYLFEHESSAFGGLLGSAHAVEIPFVFDNLDAAGVEAFVGAPDHPRPALAHAMSRAWVDVAVGATSPFALHDPSERRTARIGAEHAPDAIVVDDEPRSWAMRRWMR